VETKVPDAATKNGPVPSLPFVGADTEPSHSSRSSQRVADSISTCATYFGSAITAGSFMAAKGVNRTGQYLSQKLGKPTYAASSTQSQARSDQAPSQSATHSGQEQLQEAGLANSNAQKNAQTARNVTHAVVQVSTKTVELLAKGVSSVAQYSAPYVRQRVEYFLPRSMTQNRSAEANSSCLDAAIRVAGASVGGAATIFMALEDGAKVLGRELAVSTSGVVQNRYGANAGAITEDVLFSVGNVGQTFMMARGLRPKALLKRTVKASALEVVAPTPK